MQRSQVTQSTKHKKNTRPNQDLVTTIEANIASPMSEWRPTTQKNRQIRTTNGTSAKRLEDFDQELLQELNSLFITSDQQRVIRQILQFARKGKINASNAFEIPIKVVDPKSTESINMKFWKLSSQLLNSSMSIYDKRVDNLYLNSNKVMNDLLRVKEDNLQLKESQYQQQAKDQSNIKFQLPQLGQKLKLSSNQIKYAHLEQFQRISLKWQKRSFIKDSFLLQKTKGIDSNSLSGLMINVLELGPNLSLILDECHQQRQLELTEEQIGDFEKVVRNEIESQYRKLDKISKQQQMLPQIGKFVESYFPRSLENLQMQRQFQQYFQNSHSYSTNFYQNNNEQTVLSMCHRAGQEPSNIFSHINHSQPAKMNSFASERGTQKSALSCKEPFKKLSNLLDMEGNKEECFTITAPWEIQFKQTKLNVKKLNRGQKKGSKKSTNSNEFEIDFAFYDQQKEEILDIKQNMSPKNTRTSKFDKYILPKTINPHLQVHRAKKAKTQMISKRLTQVQQTFTNKQSVFLTASLAHSNSFLQNQNQAQQNMNYSKISQQNETITDSEAFLQNMSLQQVKNLLTFGIRNIRQIKQLVFEQLVNRSSIQIGEIKNCLAPAEMLIIFLHLVNQKNLKIESIDNESDVRLSIYS